MKKNVRELEGALNRLLIYFKTNNNIPNLETSKKLLKGFIFSPFDVANYKKIIETVSKFYNLDEKNIFDSTRRKEIVKPRQIIMYILREDFSISYPSIGEKLGGRDHTTVIHSYEKIKNEIRSDTLLLKEIQEIRSIIG